ncbi:MAG: hypothetical protein HXX14_04950 [Bacteroidetes bacterium]|nr:hypothetical protein [Bacteroidota bacterium]
MKKNLLLVVVAVVFVLNNASAQRTFEYYPDLSKNGASDLNKVIADLSENAKKIILTWNYVDRLEGSVLVKNDEFQSNTTPSQTLLCFYEISSPIKVFNNGDDITVFTTYTRFCFRKKDKSSAMKFADDLLFIQHHFSSMKDSEVNATFKPLADQYRALAVKPTVSEEQRKYIVQANSFNKERDFLRAIFLYRKAIAVDQISYPAAYFNLALIAAQVEYYNMAVFYMKRYLLLEPEAKDAREAQDKIYEWEARINK